MKQIPLVRLNDSTLKEVEDVKIKEVTFVGLRVIPGKPDKPNDFGKIALLFICHDYRGDEVGYDYYTQKIFALDSDEESRSFCRSPYNVANFDGEAEEAYKALISDMKPGINSFGTNFVFSENDTGKGKYYRFEGLSCDKDTKIDTLKRFDCTKRVWILISEIMYWVIASMPINTNIYLDSRYEHIKLCKVTGLFFLGSTSMELAGSKTELGHFELQYQDGLQNMVYKMNVMIESVPGKIPSKPMSNEEFTKLFYKTDTVSAFRFFVLTSPNRCFAMLGNEPIIDGFIVFTIDDEVAKRIHWLDWANYIYIS